MHTEGPRPALSPRQGHDAGREAAPLAGAAQARGQVKASAATPGVASCSRDVSEDPAAQRGPRLSARRRSHEADPDGWRSLSERLRSAS